LHPHAGKDCNENRNGNEQEPGDSAEVSERH
jgi:hypothetical protein